MSPIDHILNQEIIKETINSIKKNRTELILNSPQLCSLIIESIYTKLGNSLGVVFEDNNYLDICNNNIQYIDKSEVHQFSDYLNSNLTIQGFTSIESERFEIASRSLQKNKKGMYLATKSSLGLIIDSQTNKKDDLEISINNKLNTKKLFGVLDSWGYTHSDWCVSKKMYAVRGGIIDIFPTLQKRPIRIELDGNRVSSMRKFNITSQESVKKINKTVIYKPIIGLSESLDGKLNSIYGDRLKYILYIMSENKPKTTANTTRLELFCEKIISKTLPAGLLNKKTEELARTVDRVFIFNGVNGVDLKNKSIEYCGGFFNDNIKSIQLGAAFIGNSGIPQKPRETKIDGVKQKKVFKLDDIKWGDVLVHQDYGLGLYRGLDFVGSKETGEENIKIEYLGGTSVYVPINKFDRIHKYVGPGGGSPKLTKLGSGLWEKQKLTTKKSVEKVVGHLIENYKQKQKPRGYKYIGDDEIIQRVINDFPYTETPDQSSSIKDVYADMMGDKPMDRLVYGDVGFGKTEVAIRAAILAITSGRVVFFLAPTTVLSDQHYITCINRLGPVGVNVELLSRFKTRGDQKKILNNLDNGGVDLLVGTHRLLSGDVNTERLGLLIVDEEHRFGVKHKEAIRRIKNKVDVLTLTATPIPRTLQQSLVGVRDTSKIETPPQNRLPIKTFISRFDWVDIKNKVDYEMNRGGQVYFVHNEIESMPFVVDKLTGYFPDKTIEAAHGQMPNGPLEKTVLGFFNNHVDIMVCTTIIESGLDVRNANTIIVNNAQNFGLSQLYQIRGRVGRANQQAYCYLCVPKKLKLLPDAHQRLKTMEYYTSLGSGYGVAIKDLEIRGAGNMFGYEQSGQMLQVGLELYNKILADAILEERGAKTTKNEFSTKVIIDRPALIDSQYMPSAQDRLYYYQELGLAKTTKEVDEIRGRLIDQFGLVGGSVENLFIVSKIQCLLFTTPIKKCLIKEGVVEFFLGGELGLDVDVLIKKISNLSNSWGKQHKFETGGRDFKVVFNNIKVVELVSFVAAFGVLFSRVRVD